MDSKNIYVYHGSPEMFDVAIPKRQKRTQKINGKMTTIFDEISFHATPYKWIALAYTYQPKQEFSLGGQKLHYNMGVSLYDQHKIIFVHGIGSLADSLKKLYGGAGYLYSFHESDFFYMPGLGDLEVIAKKQVRPVSVERIDDPVSELGKMGVKFHFIDLADPKNEDLRGIIP